MPQSSLGYLVSGVRSFFTTYYEANLRPAIYLGWTQRARNTSGPGGANRVVFEPGKKVFGREFGPTGPGGEPRKLLSVEEEVSVYPWAVDTTDPTDEEKQIEASDALFERVVQAVHHVAHASARWVGSDWIESPIERSFGRELKASLLLRGNYFDLTHGVVVPEFTLERSYENAS